jgi:hypothetical protein
MIVGIVFLVIAFTLDRLKLHIDTTSEGWVLLWYSARRRERKYIKLWRRNVY